MNSINTNMSALSAQRNMTEQAKLLDEVPKTFFWFKTKPASDDASGSAIASKMESQIRSLGMALRNSNDAISMTQTAEGALEKLEYTSKSSRVGCASW